MVIRATLFLLVAAADVEAPTVRPIPAELAANYFYANAQFIQAKMDLDQAAGELQSFCGPGAVPGPTSNDPRKLICRPKSPPTK